MRRRRNGGRYGGRAGGRDEQQSEGVGGVDFTAGPAWRPSLASRPNSTPEPLAPLAGSEASGRSDESVLLVYFTGRAGPAQGGPGRADTPIVAWYMHMLAMLRHMHHAHDSQWIHANMHSLKLKTKCYKYIFTHPRP